MKRWQVVSLSALIIGAGAFLARTAKRPDPLPVPFAQPEPLRHPEAVAPTPLVSQADTTNARELIVQGEVALALLELEAMPQTPEVRQARAEALWLLAPTELAVDKALIAGRVDDARSMEAARFSFAWLHPVAKTPAKMIRPQLAPSGHRRVSCLKRTDAGMEEGLLTECAPAPEKAEPPGDEGKWRERLHAQKAVFLEQQYVLTAPQLRRVALIERFISNTFTDEAQQLLTLAERKARNDDPPSNAQLKAAALGDILYSPVSTEAERQNALGQLAPDSRWIRLAIAKNQASAVTALIQASLYFAPLARDVEKLRQDYVKQLTPVGMPAADECGRAIGLYRQLQSTAFAEFELGDAVCQWRGAMAIANAVALTRFERLTPAQLRLVAQIETFITGFETAVAQQAKERAEKLERTKR